VRTAFGADDATEDGLSECFVSGIGEDRHELPARSFVFNDKEKPPNARANAGGRRKPNPPPPLDVQPFGHGAGVGYGRRGITPTWVASREAAMIGVLNDLVLFSCLAAFVSGIVIAAATLII
jgi:hypothetical protein